MDRVIKFKCYGKNNHKDREWCILGSDTDFNRQEWDLSKNLPAICTFSDSEFGHCILGLDKEDRKFRVRILIEEE